MVAALKTKLPRSWFKRARPANTQPFKSLMPSESEAFVLGGEGTVAKTGRQAFWANTFAKDIINVSRLTHIQAASGAWQHFMDQGRMGAGDQEVAIIVDGSPNRPIKNVKLFGQIVIQEASSLHDMYDAVVYAFNMWASAAAPLAKSGDYVNNIHIFADNEVWVDYSLFVSGREKLDAVFSQTQVPPFFTIINTMPYAAKEERRMLPTGLAYQSWKATRSQYGDGLAVRFRYYTDADVNLGGFQETSASYKRTTRTTGRGPKSSSSDARVRKQYSAGQPLSFPAINIGQPGAFNSGATKIIIRAAIKAK